jgi:hypothetical protein
MPVPGDPSRRRPAISRRADGLGPRRRGRRHCNGGRLGLVVCQPRRTDRETDAIFVASLALGLRLLGRFNRGRFNSGRSLLGRLSCSSAAGVGLGTLKRLGRFDDAGWCGHLLGFRILKETGLGLFRRHRAGGYGGQRFSGDGLISGDHERLLFTGNGIPPQDSRDQRHGEARRGDNSPRPSASR